MCYAVKTLEEVCPTPECKKSLYITKKRRVVCQKVKDEDPYEQWGSCGKEERRKFMTIDYTDKCDSCKDKEKTERDQRLEDWMAS